MDYKKMYLTLDKGVEKVIEELKKEIYADILSTNALKFMSDLKYYRYMASNIEETEKKIKELLEKEKEKKKRFVRPMRVKRRHKAGYKCIK